MGSGFSKSAVMTGSSTTQSINVNVAGKNQLRLVVTPNGTTSFDHADWADARLTSGGGSRVRRRPRRDRRRCGHHASQSANAAGLQQYWRIQPLVGANSTPEG